MTWFSRSEYFTIVEILKEKIEQWKIKNGTLIIKVRGMSFDEMFIKSRALPFTGERYSREFICLLPVVPEGEMNRKNSALYRKLKGLESKLEWNGIFKKKPYFRFLKKEEEIKKYPGLKPDRKLIDALNIRTDLMNKIEQARIDEIIIKLFSGVDEKRLPFFGEENSEKVEISFFKNPKKIQWIFYLMKGIIFISKEKRCEKMLNLILEIMNDIVSITRDITSLYYKEE